MDSIRAVFIVLFGDLKSWRERLESIAGIGNNWGLLLLIVLFCTLGYITWDWPIDRETRVGGKIESLSGIKVEIADRSYAISPLCGCEAEYPRAFWTGLSFIRHENTFSFTDFGDDKYLLMVSAAEPGPVLPFGALNFTAFIKLKAGAKSTGLPAGFVELAALHLILDDDIVVTAQNEAPQLSAIPPSHSKTSVNFSADNDDISIEILSDKDLDHGMLPGPNPGMREDLVHMVDVLGQAVTIKPVDGFVEVDFAHPIEGKSERNVKSLKDIGLDIEDIEEITLFVPFSARFAFLKVEFPLEERENDTQPIFNGNHAKQASVWAGPGKLTIFGSKPLGEFDYLKAKKQLDRDRREWRHQKRNYKEFKKERMRYRMPIIAPRLGFQIYGTFDKLELEGASGGLTIGANDFPISGSADLSFREISPLVGDNDYPSTPLQFDKKDGGAVAFRSYSKIDINGEELVVSKYTVGGMVSLVGVMLALLMTLIQFWIWKKEKK